MAEEVELRKAWYALMIESSKHAWRAELIEDALLDHIEPGDPHVKVTVVNVQEITYRRLLEVAGQAIRDAPGDSEPVSAPEGATPTRTTPEGLTDAQEAAYELIEAYSEWLPRWRSQELMTRMVICMERFSALVREGKLG